jgi:hypothetical protein
VEGLKKPRDNWPPGRELNPGLPEYEAGVPTILSRRFVILEVTYIDLYLEMFYYLTCVTF